MAIQNMIILPPERLYSVVVVISHHISIASEDNTLDRLVGVTGVIRIQVTLAGFVACTVKRSY